MTNYIHAFLFSLEMWLPVMSTLDLYFTFAAYILLPMVAQGCDINKRKGIQSERKRQDSTIKHSGPPGQSRLHIQRAEGKHDCPAFECELDLHGITELTAMRKLSEGTKPLQALLTRNLKHGLWMEQCSVSEKPVLGSKHQSNLEMEAPVSYLSLHTEATHLGGRSYTKHIRVLPGTNTSLYC